MGRYETLFRLAAGGMAEVYVARLVGEGGFEKLVALKRMLPNIASDPRFVGMFLDEGRLASNISSPHVVSTLDLGRADDDSLYLVMELVVGVSVASLRASLRQQGQIIPVEAAAEIVAQAALGLHDAHEARTVTGEWLSIVHRDISPQNILVDVSGRVRITDFGVARAIERVTQTQTGEVKGKLAYFAPEQARSKPLDRRADVFALGIVAWELLTGQRLFSADGGVAEQVLRVLEMPIPRVDEIRPEIPVALGDAIARALERNVYDRTETAGQFAREIRAAVPSIGSEAIGTLVRERGGESLRRLEEGIRAQSSSASGRDRASLVTPARVTSEDVLTPSGVQVQSAASRASAATPAPTPTGSRGVVAVMIGLALVIAIGVGAFVTHQLESSAAPIATPLPPVMSTPTIAVAPPPTIAIAPPPSVSPEPLPAPSSTRRAGGRRAPVTEAPAAPPVTRVAAPPVMHAAPQPETHAAPQSEAPHAQARRPTGVRGIDEFDLEAAPSP